MQRFDLLNNMKVSNRIYLKKSITQTLIKLRLIQVGKTL